MPSNGEEPTLVAGHEMFMHGGKELPSGMCFIYQLTRGAARDGHLSDAELYGRAVKEYEDTKKAYLEAESERIKLEKRTKLDKLCLDSYQSRFVKLSDAWNAGDASNSSILREVRELLHPGPAPEVTEIEELRNRVRELEAKLNER